MKRKILMLFTILFVFASCGSKEGKKQDKDEVVEYKEIATLVDTMHLSRKTFNEQIVCNGKLKAIQKTALSFKTQGVIASIKVKNGSFAKEGEVLASLDKNNLQIELHKTLRSLEKSRINLIDKLIGQGYDADTTNVPKIILQSVKSSSGYFDAMDNVQAAKRKLKDADIIAPFSGKVANMNLKVWENTSEALCLLIDDKEFDVEFNLLEAEMSRVKVGQRVKISPFISPDDEYIGYVTEKNPFVDTKGQITVRAKVKNTDNKLIEGMNVKILLENKIESQYVVPKDAVLLRDNYYLVFRYVKGEAVWTYVDVVMSNIDYHVIKGNKVKQTKLSDNDIIITSGNLNLADGVKVDAKE